MNQHRNKQVLLSGGTSGIGKAIAFRLAAQGYTIFIVDKSLLYAEIMLQEAADNHLSSRIIIAHVDITDTHKLQIQLQEWLAVNGFFDILINNAGIAFGSVLGRTYTEIAYMIHSNLISHMWLSSELAKTMIEKKVLGDIIFIGSMSIDEQKANSSGYVASKSAIHGFATALRKELNPHNIRITLIEPGAVSTELQPTTVEEQYELQQRHEQLTAEDIAQFVCNLLLVDHRINICEVKIKPLKQII